MSHNFKDGDLVSFKLKGEEEPWDETVYKVDGDKAYSKDSGFITLEDPCVDYKIVSEETEEDQKSSFSLGDRVKVVKGSDSLLGYTGVVVGLEDTILRVRLEGYQDYCSKEDYHQVLESWVVAAPKETPEDNVNNPSHYGQGNIEAIDYIEDFLTDEEYIGYLRGNIGKYMHRWRDKNGLEDLKKANWYLDRLMWKMENKK